MRRGLGSLLAVSVVMAGLGLIEWRDECSRRLLSLTSHGRAWLAGKS